MEKGRAIPGTRLWIFTGGYNGRVIEIPATPANFESIEKEFDILKREAKRHEARIDGNH
jgi:hypothetical protein